MNIRLTHIDGKLPNLALMKLSHWHKSQGDTVRFSKYVTRELDEQGVRYDRVYGSHIFTWSKKIADVFMANFPDAILRGTGTMNFETVEAHLGINEYENYDYSIYPDYPHSIGFTERGCRLKCGFCFVPKKEGKPRSVNTLSDIWRGEPYPRNIVLLDNDFFGQPKEQWQARIKEMIDGSFKVCFNQGINVRLINDEAAVALKQIKYFDDQFKVKRLYTAWDNLKDEKIFLDGVDRLERAGISPKDLLVYMLIGYDPSETMERILYRFHRMTERGMRPFPMVYNNLDKELRRFQRYVVRRYYEIMSWDEFGKAPPKIYDEQTKMAL